MSQKQMHVPEVVCYVGGPGEPYYKPFVECICGWHTVNGGVYSWEEAGAEFDEHLAQVDAKRAAARKRAAERRAAGRESRT